MSGCQNWGFRSENGICCFCLLYVGERQRGNKKKNKTCKKGPEKCALGGGWGKLILWNWHSWQTCKTRFVFGRWKRPFLLTLSVWENVTFIGSIFKNRIRKHYKGCIGRRGKPNIHIFFEEGCFWKGSLKGFYYRWSTKAWLCWKHYFIEFWAKQSFCR